MSNWQPQRGQENSLPEDRWRYLAGAWTDEAGLHSALRVVGDLMKLQS